MSKGATAFMLVILSGFTLLDLAAWQSIVIYIVMAALLVASTMRRERLFHPIQPVVLAYLLGFPFSVISYELWPPERGSLAIVDVAVQPGMLWAVRGFASMCLGFVLVQLLRRQRASLNLGDEQITIASRMVEFTGAVAIAGGVASIAIFGHGLTFIEHDQAAADSAEGSLAMVLQLLYSLAQPFLAAYVMLRRRGIRKRRLDRIALILALVIGSEVASIGSKSAILSPLVAIVTGYLLGGSKLRFREVSLLLSAALGVYLTFAVVTEYRARMLLSDRSGADVFSFETQASLFADSVLASVSVLDSAAERQADVGVREVSHRLGSPMFSFANLLYATGWEPPYENAVESLLLPIYALVPRAIVDKPVFFNSGENARIFYGWAYGGVSVSLVGSFYYAWGYPGIILGMAFFGILLGISFRPIEENPLSHTPEVIFGVALLIFAVQPDITFQGMGIVLIRNAIIIWLVRMIARQRGARGPGLAKDVAGERRYKRWGGSDGSSR